jgi:hypothetical protein
MGSQPAEDSKDDDVEVKGEDSSEQSAEHAEKTIESKTESESAASAEPAGEVKNAVDKAEAATAGGSDSEKKPVDDGEFKSDGETKRTEEPTIAGKSTHKFQPHQAKIFNELLEKTAPDVTVEETRRYKHPIAIDGLLAVGLLLAMAGFTLGVVKMYIIQEAKHDISERRFTDAIAILRNAPLPGLFQMQGQSTEELLDEARYLDAVERLDKDTNDGTALKELDLIRPGSHFFDMANTIKGEHAPASAITLQGGTEHEATPSEVKNAERPLLPESDPSAK